MVRHKFRLLDLALVAIAAAIVFYIGLIIDIFANADNHTPQDMELEIDELIALSATFLVGMGWAIHRMVRERREMARRQEVEKEIRRLAFHDALTGLPNRRQFDDALHTASAAPPRAGASHAVLALDLSASSA